VKLIVKFSAQAEGLEVSVQNLTQGMLLLSKDCTVMLMIGIHNMYLSFSTMLLPTNDGFAGLNSFMIPTQEGTDTIMINSNDARITANSEFLTVIPNPTGVTAYNGADSC